MHPSLHDPVWVTSQGRRGEGPLYPAEILTIDAVGVERATHLLDDRHPAVAEPPIHVLVVAGHERTLASPQGTSRCSSR